MYITKKDLLELIKEAPEHAPVVIRYPDLAGSQMGAGDETTEDDIQVEIINESIILQVD